MLNHNQIFRILTPGSTVLKFHLNGDFSNLIFRLLYFCSWTTRNFFENSDNFAQAIATSLSQLTPSVITVTETVRKSPNSQGIVQKSVATQTTEKVANFWWLAVKDDCDLLMVIVLAVGNVDGLMTVLVDGLMTVLMRWVCLCVNVLWVYCTAG